MIPVLFLTCYLPVPANGILLLREAVSNFLSRKEKLNYSPDEILVAAGGRPLIYALYRAIVDRGDKVIYSVPSWNNNHYVHFTEGKHTIIETFPENNFMPTAKDITPQLDGAVLLALCSPLNPTGTVFKKEDLAAICDMVIEENEKRGTNEKKLYVMYDQIYWTLTYGESEHFNPVTLRPEMKKYTVFIDGISKAFAATGVRVGWAIGPQNILGKMRAINSHIGAWSPMAEQNATARFLQQTEAVEKYLNSFRQELEERLRKIYEGFMSLKKEGFSVDALEPQAAIYLTVKIDLVNKITPSRERFGTQSDVTSYLLSEAKLALVPFYAFGASKNSSWYRLSVGTCKKEEIPAVLNLLRQALQKLN